MSDFIKHGGILKQQGKIQQSLKAVLKEQPLFRAVERLCTCTVATAFSWDVWDDSPSADGKKQINERKTFVFGTLYKLSSVFYTCDLYYFDPQKPDFLVIIE